MAAGSDIVAWDIVSGTRRWSTATANADEAKRHSYGVTCLVVAGDAVLSGSEDTSVRSWSLADGTQNWSTTAANADEAKRHSTHQKSHGSFTTRSARDGGGDLPPPALPGSGSDKGGRPPSSSRRDEHVNTLPRQAQQRPQQQHCGGSKPTGSLRP